MPKSMTLLQRVQEANRILGAGEKFTRSDLIQLTTDTATELIRLQAAESTVAVDPVGRAFKLLSHSQRLAIQAIADDLTDGSGLVNASKIADRAGITRSIFTTTLRTFESAGIIKADSLGMKGTHIKGLLPGWTERLTAA